MLNFTFDINRIRRFYEENEKTVRMAALALVVGLSILFFWIHGDSRTHTISEGQISDPVSASEVSEQDPLQTAEGENDRDTEPVITAYVDISGEVNKPGVYKVDTDTRLFEVIELAGGLTENADPDSLNRAEKVWDGQKIVVLSYEDTENISSSERSSSSYSVYNASGYDDDGKVNINTADPSELQTIPGIGPSKAQAIIEYREKNGYFTVPEDIMNVAGIGQKTYSSIKDKIVV
jgi:competence protein ComEA